MKYGLYLIVWLIVFLSGIYLIVHEHSVVGTWIAILAVFGFRFPDSKESE